MQAPPDFGLYASHRALVFLPDFSMERRLNPALEAEEPGCHSLWVGDSILAKPRYGPAVSLTGMVRASRNQPEQMRRVARDVLPAFRR